MFYEIESEEPNNNHMVVVTYDGDDRFLERNSHEDGEAEKVARDGERRWIRGITDRFIEKAVENSDGKRRNAI